jgi:hypothetical protein
MPTVVDTPWQPDEVTVPQEIRHEARRLRQAIAAIDYVLPGTLSRRVVRCGRTGCRCHADPPELHGPYWWWTRKVNKKTVTRLLTDEQAVDYQEWFQNAHRLRELIAELEALALRAVEADPRSARRPGGRRPAADA